MHQTVPNCDKDPYNIIAQTSMTLNFGGYYRAVLPCDTTQWQVYHSQDCYESYKRFKYTLIN